MMKQFKRSTLKHSAILCLVFMLIVNTTACSKDPAGSSGGDGGAGAGGNVEAESIRFAQVAGEVKFVKNSDTVWIPAVQGMALALEDTLATGKSSEADLDVDENKHVLVGDEVRMVVAQLMKEVGNSKTATLKVDSGAVYIRIQKKLGQGETFEVVTPTCIMGVRGTHFVVDVVGGDTLVSVLEGEVKGTIMTTRAKSTDAIVKGPDISIKGGEQVRIPMGAKKEADLIRVPLTPDKLPSFVLETLKTENEGLPEIYKTPLEPIIEKVKSIEAGRKIGSGSRYVDPVSGHVYARFDDAMAFEKAQAFCEAQGGHLMTIGDGEEQGIAEGLIAQGGKAFYLIGLSQTQGSTEPDQGFNWVTGEPLTFERWHREGGAQVEPNNSAAGGKPETHVTLANAGSWPKGDWNDQNLETLGGNYGFLCEWDSIDAVLIPDGIGGASDSSGSGKINYPFYVTLNLGDPVTNAIEYLGKGNVSDSSGIKTHVWTDDDKLLAVKEKNGTITATVQKNLETSVVEKDLSNVKLRGSLINCKSLTEVESLLGTEGIITGRLLMNGSDSIVTRQWKDGSGNGYVATLNETTGKLDHSFSK